MPDLLARWVRRGLPVALVAATVVALLGLGGILFDEPGGNVRQPTVALVLSGAAPACPGAPPERPEVPPCP